MRVLPEASTNHTLNVELQGLATPSTRETAHATYGNEMLRGECADEVENGAWRGEVQGDINSTWLSLRRAGRALPLSLLGSFFIF